MNRDLASRIALDEVIRGNDLGDAMDSLWANAFGTAPLVNGASISVESPPSGRVSLSQEPKLNPSTIARRG